MPNLLTLGITVLGTLASVFGIYNYLPLSVLQPESQMLGATITTINGSDTLSSSRTVINTNFANLNADKFELSAWYATTSAEQITKLGTIGTGVWQGTPITVAYGGTGSTTLSSNQVLLGNGTGIVKTVSGWGTSGQLLTSGGASAAPTWTTVTADQTANYTWTGLHTFSATTTQATSTINSLKTAAGTLVAADPNGVLIATSTPITSYVGAIVSTTTAVVANTTQDNTFSPGFLPSLIRINYRLQGKNDANTVYQEGWVEYPGTTSATANYQLTECPNTGANSTIDATTWVLDATDPQCGRGDSHAAAGTFAGLTITSVTSTGFTVRTTFTVDTNTGGAAKYYVTAYR